MYCVRCGGPMQEDQRFCPACGAPAAAAVPVSGPSAPPATRIEGHIRILGILWIVVSAFRLIPGLFLLSIFRWRRPFMPPAMPLPFAHGEFIHAILTVTGAALIAGAALGLAAGIGLLQRQPWARMLAIVLGFISLVDVPFGTALGAYTLWVLLSGNAETEYRHVARRA